MWPFNRRPRQLDDAQNDRVAPKTPGRDREPVRWPRLADSDTYARLFAEDVGLSLIVATFNPAVLRSRDNSDARVPAISLVLLPGATIDFAHPEHGFTGWVEPPAERVLRLWADDLLTISHGNVWRFVIAGEEPFDRDWVETMFPPAPSESDFIPERALVVATFGADHRQGEFALTDIDDSPMTLTHIEDQRRG